MRKFLALLVVMLFVLSACNSSGMSYGIPISVHTEEIVPIAEGSGVSSPTPEVLIKTEVATPTVTATQTVVSSSTPTATITEALTPTVTETPTATPFPEIVYTIHWVYWSDLVDRARESGACSTASIVKGLYDPEKPQAMPASVAVGTGEVVEVIKEINLCPEGNVSIGVFDSDCCWTTVLPATNLVFDNYVLTKVLSNNFPAPVLGPELDIEQGVILKGMSICTYSLRLSPDWGAGLEDYFLPFVDQYIAHPDAYLLEWMIPTNEEVIDLAEGLEYIINLGIDEDLFLDCLP